MWILLEKKMKISSCIIQKKLYAPRVMNIPKKLAFTFQAILNRFFSIIQTDNHPKVINFVSYEQEVNTEQKNACFQGLIPLLPVDKHGINRKKRLITSQARKIIFICPPY